MAEKTQPHLPAKADHKVPAFLRSRLFANAVAAWARLRAPHRGPEPTTELHNVFWVFWFAMAVVAVVQIAIIFDDRSVDWARGLPRWIEDGFQWLTEIGRLHWVLVPTGIAGLLLLFGDWRGTARALRAAWAEIGILIGYVFFAVGGAAIVINLLKPLIGRGRPVGYDENGWLSFNAFTFDYANASFPSGHATTAGAVLVAGALIFPRFRAPIIVLGLLIALSRVVVGAHFPSDIVAGLVVGIATAYLTARYLLRRRIGFRLDKAGRIRPRLGATKAAARKLGVSAVFTAPWRALAGRPNVRHEAD